jgi:hypothetical protein
MLTLLTTVISFLSGGLPNLLSFFQDRSDKKHELALAQVQFQQQLELQKAGFVAQKELEEVRLDEIKTQTTADIHIADIQAEANQRSALYSHDIAIGQGASQWVINMRASVRPVINFGLFGLIVFVDVFGFYYAIHTNVPFDVALNILWDDETQTIWASVVSFWFGTQAFAKK